MPRTPPKPKEKRRPTGVQIGEFQARGMVLQGGAMVFAEKGVRAASVDDILVAARVARRTFYRLYSSKEDVMVALYKLGTDVLLEGCKAAVAKEPDLLRQVERFVDAHLLSARNFGRLIFVLGGEAARHESLLHARRMEVHEALAALLMKDHKDVDPLLVRGVILALEGVTRMMLEEGDHGRKITPEAIERTRKVMLRIATGTIAGDGPGVTPMPTRPATD